MAVTSTDKLKKTRWYKPTCERYRAYIELCINWRLDAAPFETFASEVLNTPEDKRDWLLADEPVANYEPFVRFAQYEMPRGDEMFFNTARRNK